MLLIQQVVATVYPWPAEMLRCSGSDGIGKCALWRDRGLGPIPLPEIDGGVRLEGLRCLFRPDWPYSQ